MVQAPEDRQTSAERRSEEGVRERMTTLAIGFPIAEPQRQLLRRLVPNYPLPQRYPGGEMRRCVTCGMDIELGPKTAAHGAPASCLICALVGAGAPIDVMNLGNPDSKPETALFAWYGEDEFGSGEVGLKQGLVPAGVVPLVAVKREKVDRPEMRAQLQEQANAYGKTIRLGEFVFVRQLVELTPTRGDGI
jgi:hypothetical protein